MVYQNIDPDLLVNPGDTAYLDLDGDGTDDLMFWIRSQQGMISTAEGGSFSYTYRMAYASGLNNNVIFGEPGSSGGYEFLMPLQLFIRCLIADTLELFPARPGWLLCAAGWHSLCKQRAGTVCRACWVCVSRLEMTAIMPGFACLLVWPLPPLR